LILPDTEFDNYLIFVSADFISRDNFTCWIIFFFKNIKLSSRFFTIDRSLMHSRF